jgi:hypothetical protein
MWLLKKNFTTEKEVFCICGKALFLTQKFEKTCKEIINWLQIVDTLLAKKLEFMSDEYMDYCSKLSNMLLGSSIKSIDKIRSQYEITDMELSIINDAKNSRNWIAHDLCEKNIINNLTTQSAIYELPVDFHDHVLNIIEGDYLVSKWSYEFHEKESGAFFDKSTYIADIFKWIYL